VTSYNNKFRGNQKEVQIGQLTKAEMANLNEMRYTDEMDEMCAMIKYRKNDIKMMLNLGGNLEII